MSSERANELDALVAGLPAAERDRARAADRLLRSVPAPPPRVPDRLARAVAGIPAAHEGERARRRRLTALAFAAVVAALAFGAGTRVAGDGFDARRAIAMRPTVNAPGASAVIRLGAPDASGNWALRLEVEGLPKLPEDGYYVLWLARGREYGATCGSFSVGRREASAEWTVSYPLQRFDRWVVTAWLPGQKTGDEAPWLLMADVPADVGPPGAQGATRPAAMNAS